MNDKEATEILQEEHRYCLEPCYVMNAIAQAITALQEREERSKGCEWCIGFCPDVTGDPYADYRYCHMCGRKLKEN